MLRLRASGGFVLLRSNYVVLTGSQRRSTEVVTPGGEDHLRLPWLIDWLVGWSLTSLFSANTAMNEVDA